VPPIVDDPAGIDGRPILAALSRSPTGATRAHTLANPTDSRHKPAESSLSSPASQAHDRIRQ